MFDEEEKIKNMISMAWALGNDDVLDILGATAKEESEEITCNHCNGTLRLDNHRDEV